MSVLITVKVEADADLLEKAMAAKGQPEAIAWRKLDLGDDYPR